MTFSSPLIPKPYPTQCYCWGSSSGGKGVLGNTSDEILLSPKRFDFNDKDKDNEKLNADFDINGNADYRHANVDAVYCGNNISIAVTFNGKVYSWGRPSKDSSLGRKCNATSSDHATPKRLQIETKTMNNGRHRRQQSRQDLSAKHISVRKVAYGENHSALLYQDRIVGMKNNTSAIRNADSAGENDGNGGSVYTFGDASDGKLGIRGKRRGKVDAPLPVQWHLASSHNASKEIELSRAVDIACGYSSTHLLACDHKSLVSFGAVGNSQQGRGGSGRGSNNAKCHEPSTFTFPITIDNISSGSFHCLAVATKLFKGHMFSWGMADNGRLGHGPNDSAGKDYEDIGIQSKPKLVEYFVQNEIVVKMGVCGSAHSMALSTQNELYSFGWNGMYGQCGISIDVGDLWTPTKIRMSEEVIEVECGFAHTMAINLDGELFAWGFNECGQLGIGTDENTSIPTLVVVNFPQVVNQETTVKDDWCLTNISCGKTHSMAVASHCTMRQYIQRKVEIQVTVDAIQTLYRFARYSLYRLRVKQIVATRKKRNEECTAVEATSPIHIIEDLPLSPSRSSEEIIDDESSDASSWSYAFDETIEEIQEDNPSPSKSIYISRISELSILEEEDIASREAMKFYNERLTKLKKSKLNIITEIKRRWETALMCREDLSSSKLRQAKKNALDDLKKQRESEELKQRKSERLQRRQAKIHLQTQKEATRMRKVKEQQVKPSQRKNNMKSRVAVGSGNRLISRKKKIRSAPSPSTIPLLPAREKNRRLLVQRENRKKALAVLKAEEETRQNEMKKELIMAQQKEKEHRKRLAMREIMQANALLMEKKKKHQRMLAKMKEDIDPQRKHDDSADGRNYSKGQFRSVRHWSRELL